MIRRKKIINSLGHCLDMLVNSQIKCDEKVVFFALDFFVRQFALQTTATNCLQPSEKYDKMHDYTVRRLKSLVVVNYPFSKFTK